MVPADSDQITLLLRSWSHGEKVVADQVIPLVYSELRRLADSYLRRERPGHTLQPTALIHEAYLRLANQKEIEWQNRSHFYGVAASDATHSHRLRARASHGEARQW